MVYKLTQVSVKNYSLTGGGGYATESITLGFSEIEWRFTEGNIRGKWSVTDNTGS
jgi:type VI protein secretion system component Hcp